MRWTYFTDNATGEGSKHEREPMGWPVTPTGISVTEKQKDHGEENRCLYDPTPAIENEWNNRAEKVSRLWDWGFWSGLANSAPFSALIWRIPHFNFLFFFSSPLNYLGRERIPHEVLPKKKTAHVSWFFNEWMRIRDYERKENKKSTVLLGLLKATRNRLPLRLVQTVCER